MNVLNKSRFKSPDHEHVASLVDPGSVVLSYAIPPLIIAGCKLPHSSTHITARYVIM